MDIFASLSDAEYFAESKYNQETKSIRAKSREFKDGVLEFVGLEKYRTSSFKDSVDYLFITNNSIQRLALDLGELQSMTSEELANYRVELEVAGREKWKDFDAEISEKNLRNVLNRLILVEVNDSSLREAQESPDYFASLLRIIERARARGHDVPVSLMQTHSSTIAIGCDGNNYEHQLFEKLGFALRVEKKLLSNLIKFKDNLAKPSTALRIDASDLPFLRSLRIECPLGRESIATQAFTELLNDQILTDQRNLDIFVQLSYDERALLVFNKSWISNLADQSLTREGKYEVAKVAAKVPFAVPYDVLTMAIIESKRLEGIVIDHGFFEIER